MGARKWCASFAGACNCASQPPTAHMYIGQAAQYRAAGCTSQISHRRLPRAVRAVASGEACSEEVVDEGREGRLSIPAAPPPGGFGSASGGDLSITLLARGRFSCGEARRDEAARDTAAGVERVEVAFAAAVAAEESTGLATATGDVVAGGVVVVAAVLSPDTLRASPSGLRTCHLVLAGVWSSWSQLLLMHRFILHSGHQTEATLSSQMSQVGAGVAAVPAEAETVVDAPPPVRMGSWIRGLLLTGAMTLMARVLRPPPGAPKLRPARGCAARAARAGEMEERARGDGALMLMRAFEGDSIATLSCGAPEAAGSSCSADVSEIGDVGPEGVLLNTGG